MAYETHCQAYSGPSAGPYHSILTSVIAVPDEFNVASTTVEISLKRRRIGALSIQLEKTSVNADPIMTMLKAGGLGGLGNDLLRTVFDESAPEGFPPSDVSDVRAYLNLVVAKTTCPSSHRSCTPITDEQR